MKTIRHGSALTTADFAGIEVFGDAHLKTGLLREIYNFIPLIRFLMFFFDSCPF